MKTSIGVLLGFVCILCAAANGVVITDSDYRAESVVSYLSNGIGHAKNLCFDDSGNMYISHDGETNGTILRVSSDGSIENYITGGHNIQGTTWGGGTAYGDYVYSAHYKSDYVVQSDLSGTASVFSNLLNRPLSVGIDRVGNYGNYMYAGGRYSSAIYRIDQSGSFELFSSYASATGVSDIQFDPGTMYGGLMYAVLVADGAEENGLYSVDSDGNYTRFLLGKFGAGHVDFDISESQAFGGGMYASASRRIFSVDPQGNLDEFLWANGNYICDFAFGPDDAMYVLWRDGDSNRYNVDRVSLIPEPCSLLLLGFGGLLLRRRV